MTKEDAAAQIGERLVRELDKSSERGPAVLKRVEDMVGQSVRKKGVVRSLLLVAVAFAGLKWPVTLLLEKGANIETNSNNSPNPSDTKDTITLLQENMQWSFSQKLEHALLNGETALIAAAREGHEAVVRLLLEKGANVDAEDKGCRTALMWASQRGCVPIANLLLEKGANINKADKNGYTALILAVNRGHVAGNIAGGPHEAIVHLLVVKGASTKAKSKPGHIAQEYTTSGSPIWQYLNGR
jgi:ankyrin repeat protein